LFLKDKKIKAAVIGMGPHGRRIVDVIGRFSQIELAAVVDRQASALAYEKLPAATARLESTAEVWSGGGVDLVCVATNGPSHAPLAAEAISRGARYLMLEKPMACSVAECDQIIEQAARAQTRVAVDHVRRHAPAYRWLRERIASGDWGRMRTIWMQRPGIGLGCNAVHSFDTVRFLTGREARRVTAWVDDPIGKNPRGADFVDPGGLVVMDMGSDLRAVVAQIEDGAGPTSVEIDMTAARIRLDEQSGAIEIVERDLSVKPGPGRPAAYKRSEPPAGLSAKTDMLLMIEGCLADLLHDGPVESDAAQGLATVEILVAAHLSQRRGNVPIDVPLTSPSDRKEWLPVT
jgi:predicted dehydrogenase